MKVLFKSKVDWLGIDEVGDVLVRFKCGHLIGYPLELIKSAEKSGQGLELRHSSCGITEFIAPEDTQGMTLRLLHEFMTPERFHGTSNGTSVDSHSKKAQKPGSKPESKPPTGCL